MSVTPARLRECRMAKKLSMSGVEQAAHIGYKTISAWEHGKCEPGAWGLRLLAPLYGVTADYLLGLTDVKGPNFERGEKRNAEQSAGGEIRVGQGAPE
jgi:transcriptional regulator with XRE-family HTH domain